uniref:5'-3' exoribonuclease n=1 Tax=Bionectria ochroleuca TaxID=29856 RepID=A0A8H7N5M3_BIOOC
MLGLATHEPHFRVLREDVFFQQSKTRTCQLCGQKGHEARNCRGEAKEKDGEFDEKDSAIELKPFIWLHVAVLREYLAVELSVPGLPFRFDLERAVDDWIFMCCFVGNDFLPHLPALEIREDGIDTLTAIWRDNLPSMGGYVTKDGHIDMDRAQCILDGLAKQEDAIFKRRREQEQRREANAKRRKLQNEANSARNGGPGGKLNPKNQDHTAPHLLHPIGSFPQKPPGALTHDMIVNRAAVQDANAANKSAADVLKNRLKAEKALPPAEKGVDTPESPPSLGKRKAAEFEEDNGSTTSGNQTPAPAADEGPTDTVRMWEEGYADRYYEQKFHKDPSDIEFRHQVGRAYAEGLAWVLLYYFQGCPSWEWYYPYHYAPFAADFKDLGKMNIRFEKGRISRPFEQLMSVLPAASRHAIPEIFHPLMLEPDSEIIDFYPEDFLVDLNGKKFAWQGVALLPFIDMPRLLGAVQKKYPLLSADDTRRNDIGTDNLLFSDSHEGIYDEVLTNFYSKKQGAPQFKLNSKTSGGLTGKVIKQEDYVPHGMLQYPLDRKALPDLDYDRSISVIFEMPVTTHTHKSMLLRGVKLPTAQLTRSDIEVMKGKARRGGRSYGGAPLGRHDQGNGRREPIHYGSESRYNNGPRGGHRGGGRGGYHGGNGSYSQYDAPGRSYPSHPPAWQPPPPGAPGFGMGVPPPPPGVHFQNGHRQNHGHSGSYSGHRGSNDRRDYPPPPPQHWQNGQNRDWRGQR